MKKINQLFYSILLILFIFIPFSYLTTNVNAVISEDNLTIKSNWLYVQNGNYVDNTPASWKNNIKFSTGGKDLYRFQNLGVSVNGTDLLFKSQVRFGFEINAYTDVDYTDIYPNVHEETCIQNFLTIDNRGWFWARTSIEHYNVEWNTLVLGNTYRNHLYNGHIPITIGIQDILPPSGIISLNGISFHVPIYTYDIVEVGVSSVRDGEAGAYEDIFTNAGVIDAGTVTSQVLRRDDFSAEERNIISAINSWNLGWEAGQIERSRNIQNWKKDTAPEGSTWTTLTFDENIPYILNLPITLQPEVYTYTQRNQVRRVGIVYDEVCGLICDVFGPSTELAPERIVAVHTTNPFIHSEFYVDVNFYASVSASAELVETVLADPYLKRGDFVWDTSFTGAYKVDTTWTKSDWLSNAGDYLFDLIFGSFGWIIWLIIGIIVIYLFIKIGVPYLINKQKRRNK